MNMTPQERDLIDRLFTRLSAEATGAKDPEAVAFIIDRVRTLPDPAYTLVHALAVQEVTLQQARARIADLERQLAAAAAQPASGGSFLGAATATVAPTARPLGAFQSVAPQPVYQGQPTPQQQQPIYQAQPVYQAQPAYQPQQSFAGAPTQPGGFMHSVLGTAAGVAGGMLAAEAVTSLFTGGHHGAFSGGLSPWDSTGGVGGGPWGGGGNETIVNETVVNNNYYDDGNSSQSGYSNQDYSSNDPGSDFASDSSDMGTDIGYDGGGGGGSDWG